MSPLVAAEDLIDVPGVTKILGPSNRNSVSLYRRCGADMPHAVVDLRDGRVKLWLRAEIARWAAQQASVGRTPSCHASR